MFVSVYQVSPPLNMGVGDGGVRGHDTTLKSEKNYFSGNRYVKFGHFSGKNHVKFVNFVNFSGKCQ